MFKFLFWKIALLLVGILAFTSVSYAYTSSDLAALEGTANTAAVDEYKPRLGIQLFEDKSGAGAPGEAITDMMTTELASSDLFTVVEREKLYVATNEQDLANSGLMDMDTTPEYGKLMGAEFAMTGAITQYQTDTSAGIIPIPILGGIAIGSHTATVMLDVRIINNRTGEVIMSIREAGSSNQTIGGLATRYGAFGGGKTGGVMAGATHKAVTKIIERIQAEGLSKMQAHSRANTEAEVARRSANVLNVDQKFTTATIDAGAKVGIRKGAYFAVYRVGNIIKDFNGKVLGEEKNYIAILQVTDAQMPYSTCKVLKGKGFRRGDKAQRISSPNDVTLKL